MCVSIGVSYLLAFFLPKTLKMVQTSVPETLVINQKLTPGYNPKTFKQQKELCFP
jgi:hypothetical protein